MPTFQFDNPVTPFSGIGQATQNLLVGDMSAAWRAMLTPDDLGPLERDALLNKIGIAGDSFKGRILRTITNPAVLLSIGATFLFPIPTARNLFKVKAGVESMLAKVPFLRSFAGPRVAFKGTPVPEILDNIETATHGFWDKHMSGILAPAFSKYEIAVGHAVTAREQAIIFSWLEKLHVRAPIGWDKVGILMPNLDKHMTKPMRDVATAVRKALDNTKTTLFEDAVSVAALRKTAKRMRDTGYPDEGLDQIVSMLGKGKGTYSGLPNYMPHRVVRTELDIINLRAAALATANNEDFKRQAQYRMMNFLGREFYQRKGGMVPALQELMVVGDLVDSGAYLRLTNGIKDKLVAGFKTAGMGARSVANLERRTLDEIMSRGNRLVSEGELPIFQRALADNMPAQYSIKLEPVLQQYYHSVSRTYAWSVKENGTKLLGEVQRAKLLAATDSRAAWRANMLENTVIPSALGKPTPRQVINAGLWDQRMGEIVATLDRPSIRGLIGDKFANTLKEYYHANLGTFSLRGLTMGASSYFYMSTLGLNPSAAFKNAFQPVFSTGALVGFKNMFAGHADAWAKSDVYFRARMSKGMGHVDAIAKAFPEFAEAGLAGNPVIDEALGRAFESAYRIHKTAPGSISLVDRAKRAGMAMFTATETHNRVGAFYAGLRHAAQDGLKGAEAVAHARKIVVRSQLVGSLADTPMIFQSGGVLANPLLRQLAQFPVRTLEFTAEGVQEALTGNPARMIRQVAGVYITSEIGDVLGINLGDALMGGISPMFSSVNEKGAILAPLPIVPPVIALGAGIASTLTGDWETIHRQLPLLVPGGVGLARAVGFIPGSSDVPKAVARWLGRKHADYKGVNPLTGRIPVYTGQGNLTGYYSPWEITKYALGIRGGGIDEEAQAAQQLAKDGDLMKQVRRNYTDALFANDPRKAAGIEAEYEKRFGHRIAITINQIRAMQKRRKLTRIEKQLATLPREARPQYEKALTAAGLLPRTSSGRRKAVTGPPPAYTNNMGLLDEFDPYSVSRYRNIPGSFPGG